MAARRLARDPRAEAQYGDRIPYVITRGEPKQRLVDRAFEPLEVLRDRWELLDDVASSVLEIEAERTDFDALVDENPDISIFSTRRTISSTS